MSLLTEFGPFFLAMLLLTAGSAFFSCSEAALFSLQSDDRRRLETGNAASQLALTLLNRPDRLLSAILLWNLIINILYFTLASVIGIQLERQGRVTEGALVAIGSLLCLIITAEMIPKTIGVQQPARLSAFVSLPLAAAVRLTDPLMPLFSTINDTLSRLLFPNFQSEPYLEIADLERAIDLSTQDEQLAAREHSALNHIVSLSEITAEELMRPRRQYQAYPPPVHLEQLGGQLTPSGYLLVTEPDSEEIAAAIPLKHLPNIPRKHLEDFARPVVYVPWCASVAIILERLEREQREVAAVVNENGETIGIVTLEDILETIFQSQSSRSERLHATSSIHQLQDNLWQVTGITSLRRLSRHFNVPLASRKSMTVAGVLHECLQRLPEVGDQVHWNGFVLKLSSIEEQDMLIVHLSHQDPERGTDHEQKGGSN